MDSASKEPESEAIKAKRPQWEGPGDQTIDRLDAKTINKKLVTGQGWDVVLSESSDDSDAEGTIPKKVTILSGIGEKYCDVFSGVYI